VGKVFRSRGYADVGIEQRLGSLEDAILQLTVHIRELTDIYIGAIEMGDMSKLTPIAVKLRNRRADRKGETREYSLQDARQWFMDFNRTFGEQKTEILLMKFNINTISHLKSEDINRFVLTIREELEK